VRIADFSVANNAPATVNTETTTADLHPDFEIMPALSAPRRPFVLVAAMTAGVMTAMVVHIMLGRHGIELAGEWRGLLRGGGQLHAAMAWWSITGAAFVASFIIAGVMSRFSWLYLRFLRAPAAAALALWLATLTDEIPVPAAGAAGNHALATLAALVVALMMAWFGAFFAVRR